jgi:hypothetical protein
MMTLRGTITVQDYIEALRIRARPARWTLTIGALICVLGFLVALIGFQDVLTGKGRAIVPIAGLMPILSVCVFHFFALPQSARRIFKQQRSMRDEFENTIDDAGFHSKTARFTGTCDWSYFATWAEGERVFVLYQSDALMNILPKRHFIEPNATHDFRVMLERKLPRAKNNRP